MIMANNPYFNEQQRQKFMQGKQAQRDANQPTIRQVSASLDKETMNELKDIGNNTLETAINTLDIKEGMKSFEDKFKEKFAGFKEQFEKDEPIAEQLPDFVGPIRPISLFDESSKNVQNDVTVNQHSSFGKIEEHTKSISDAITNLVNLYEKTDRHQPLPEPVPEEEPVVDNKRKRITDEEKRGKTLENIADSLKAIKGITSNLLSRFIGYSLEAMAKFAKWTVILGGLLIGFDILKKVIVSWFRDILNNGEASKKLFGSYFPQIKKLAQSIEEGIEKFDVEKMGDSLKNLFIKPFSLLGDVIKTAIMEGIGNLVYSLGQYTGSDTITDAGRNMKISALRDKQAAGLEIGGQDLIMLKEQELKEQEENEKKTIRKIPTSFNSSDNWRGGTSYNQMTNMGKFSDKDKAQLQALDEARKAAEIQKELTKQKRAELEAIKKDPDKLQQAVDVENANNRKRVAEQEVLTAKQEKTKPVATNEIEKAQEYIDKDNISAEDIKAMEKIMNSLEEKNNSRSLTDEDADRWRDMLEQWQNKIAAVPESSAKIDTPVKPQQAPTQTASSGNIQVNQKTVNNTVTHSVQRTDRKPLISLA